MTPDEIQAIRNRLDKATPGPWKAGVGISLSYVTHASDIWTDVADGIESADDADLIAHAPTDLAALLDEVERLREEVARQQNMPCAKLIAELRAQVTILTQDHLWETGAVERVRSRLASRLEAAWDSGNGMGLDGWTGPERGEEPDEHAIERRRRLIDRLTGELLEGIDNA